MVEFTYRQRRRQRQKEGYIETETGKDRYWHKERPTLGRTDRQREKKTGRDKHRNNRQTQGETETNTGKDRHYNSERQTLRQGETEAVTVNEC